jgi:hypothetical protein
MFPEDVHLNILSFLGTKPRKRCWSHTNRHKHRCKNHVANRSSCLFCPIHEKVRFNLPLFKPYQDLIYVLEQIDIKADPTIIHATEPINIVMGYPHFPYV